MLRQKSFEGLARATVPRHNTSIKDIDFKVMHGPDRGTFLQLTGGDWIRQHRSLLITGPAGVGRCCLARALG